MNLDQAFNVPTHVVTHLVEDELVLLDLESGTYFALEPVGARIWELLAKGGSVAAIRDTMLEEFDVEPGVLERDIGAFLGDLKQRNLIESGQV